VHCTRRDNLIYLHFYRFRRRQITNRAWYFHNTYCGWHPIKIERLIFKSEERLSSDDEIDRLKFKHKLKYGPAYERGLKSVKEL
jgi:hypothetical protein